MHTVEVIIKLDNNSESRIGTRVQLASLDDIPVATMEAGDALVEHVRQMREAGFKI